MHTLAPILWVHPPPLVQYICLKEDCIFWEVKLSLPWANSKYKFECIPGNPSFKSRLEKQIAKYAKTAGTICAFVNLADQTSQYRKLQQIIQRLQWMIHIPNESASEASINVHFHKFFDCSLLENSCFPTRTFVKSDSVNLKCSEFSNKFKCL